MIIIGVDFHPEFQQIALVDTETGEFQEKRLGHREEAEKFLPCTGGPEGACRNGGQRARTLVRDDCSRNCGLSCGSGMPRRFEPSECASRRRIARMRNCY